MYSTLCIYSTPRFSSSLVTGYISHRRIAGFVPIQCHHRAQPPPLCRPTPHCRCCRRCRHWGWTAPYTESTVLSQSKQQTLSWEPVLEELLQLLGATHDYSILSSKAALTYYIALWSEFPSFVQKMWGVIYCVQLIHATNQYKSWIFTMKSLFIYFLCW